MKRWRVTEWLRGARDAGQRARDGVGPSGKRVAPTVRLMRRDRKTALEYAKHVGPMRQSLGAREAEWYFDLVSRASLIDAQISLELARELPSDMAVVPAALRQNFVELVKHALLTKPTAAPLASRTAGIVLTGVDSQMRRPFVDEALRLFDESEAVAESFLRGESEASRRTVKRLTQGVQLADVQRVLELYAKAHCGEDLVIRPLAPGARGYVEGRTLHLPRQVVQHGDERDFLIYRVMTAQCTGYLEFGTFDLDLDTIEGPWRPAHPEDGPLDRLYDSFTTRSMARDLFQILEDKRVERRVGAVYPGLARDLRELRADPAGSRPDLDELSPADQVVEVLARAANDLPIPPLDPILAEATGPLLRMLDQVTGLECTVHDVAASLPSFYEAAATFMIKAKARQRLDEREPQEGSGRANVDRMQGEEAQDEADGAGESGLPGASGLEAGEGSEEIDVPDYEGVVMPSGSAQLGRDELAESVRELALEIDRLERERLDQLSGDSRRQKRLNKAPISEEDRAAARRLAEHTHEGGALMEGTPAERVGLPDDASGEALEADEAGELYAEWDCLINDYKPDWVQVYEVEQPEGDPAFARRVRDERRGLIKQLRHSFEAMRPEHSDLQRRRLDGDELDVDAAIESVVLRRVGQSPSERIYARRHPAQRDVAAAFLVDLSSSTNEVVGQGGPRIIDVEKEALVCISEALDALGDRFAIYGFSGYSRGRVDIYRAKAFTEPLSDTVRERIGGLRWKMENRDGAAIRHVTQQLLAQRARVSVLFLLSDGRPLDCGCDHYYDRYAQEDTRVALQEARQLGVHPFCLTVDPHGARYLEQMYGAGHYTIVEEVTALPARLPALYRRLTR